MGNDEHVTIGMVSIVPSTGDLVYDEFLGGFHLFVEVGKRAEPVE